MIVSTKFVIHNISRLRQGESAQRYRIIVVRIDITQGAIEHSMSFLLEVFLRQRVEVMRGIYTLGTATPNLGSTLR